MKNLSEAQRAIISTLVYVEQFDYCLTKQELFVRLLSKKRLDYSEFEKALLFLESKKLLSKNQELYFLPEKKDLVAKRLLRKKNSAFFIQNLKKRLWLFKFFPSIKGVLLTGSLAVANSTKDDDIDMLLITSRKTLWLSRFLILIVTGILGWRRKFASKSFAQKWCLNIFLEEDSLEIDRSQRNLYTAYEIMQTKQIYPKGDFWRSQFLGKNMWLKKYLPQVNIPQNRKLKRKNIKKRTLIGIINDLFYHLQIWYMKPKITREIIKKDQVFFHPKPLSKIVLKIFNDGLKRF